VTKEKISHLAKTLPDDRFLQIHRSFVVSIIKIESVGPGFVEINRKKLPIGRNYKPRLNKLLENN
jgi:DNA-binding LytR/AlgR family response regulator